MENYKFCWLLKFTPNSDFENPVYNARLFLKQIPEYASGETH